MQVKKKIAIMLIIILLTQIIFPIITILTENVMTLLSIAVEENSWDISKNGDGSVIATLDENGVMTISGTGEMKNWSSSLERPYNSRISDIKKVIIQEGVTSIGNYAFENCSSLINIEIPEGVTRIGPLAFKNCSSLTSIEIPERVTIIGSYAFYGCSSLTSIEIPEGVTSIGPSAFANCSSLTSIHIPQGVTNIEEYAFANCSSLTSVHIPQEVTNIEKYAFSNCSSLTSINIPSSIKSIDNCVFMHCSSLISIDIPEGVTSIGYWAFNNCNSLTIVEIPEGVISLGQYVFNACDKLQRIAVPKSVTNIRNYAFNSCPNLTIYCNSNSYIENYAIQNKKRYVIDDEAPTINSVRVCAKEETSENVMIIVEAEDSGVGLAKKAYSFDGGETWQEENTKEYNKNASGIVIKVRDALGNISENDEKIDISNMEIIIDDEAPTINSVIVCAKEEISENVMMIVNAEDSGVGLAKKAYSFDGGETWQEENTKEYNKNASGIVIKVRDALGNIEEYNEIIKFFQNIATEEYEGITVIKEIQPKTTIKQLKEKIITNGEIAIYKNGEKITDENEILGTGMAIKISLNEQAEEYIAIVRGDVNGDGEANIKDIMRINLHRLNKSNLEGIYEKAGDINNDGQVDIKDIMNINLFRLGKINVI